MDKHYAESVSISALSEDLSRSFDVRLGRFPPQGTGSLWISAYIDGVYYAVADESLELAHLNPSDIDHEAVEFQVTGSSTAHFESSGRNSPRMTGIVRATSMLHGAEHPGPGTGTIPVSVTAEFRVAHRPVEVRPGRMEVMGSIKAELLIDGAVCQFDSPGKWHEQTGSRRSFAPAFTYLFVQGDGIGIMATRHVQGAWGYVFANGVTTRLTGFEIDPYGSRTRVFTATLEDGRTISGTAEARRQTSVPIEGRRRPGATVAVKSDLVPMAGALNDWNPGD